MTEETIALRAERKKIGKELKLIGQAIALTDRQYKDLDLSKVPSDEDKAVYSDKELAKTNPYIGTFSYVKLLSKRKSLTEEAEAINDRLRSVSVNTEPTGYEEYSEEALTKERDAARIAFDDARNALSSISLERRRREAKASAEKIVASLSPEQREALKAHIVSAKSTNSSELVGIPGK